MNAWWPGRELLLPRPGFLCLRLGLALAIPLALAARATEAAAPPAIGLLLAVFVAAQTALAIGTAHKEILASSPAFFRGGLGRQLFAAQLVWALGVAGALAVGLRLRCPELPSAWLGSALGAVLVVHALAVQATLRLAWSFQLPLWLYYVYFLVPVFARSVAAGSWDKALEAPWAWLGTGVLLHLLLARTLGSRALARRLNGRLVLGVEDLFRPGRLQQFKSACQAGAAAGGGPRWRRALIASCLRRAAAARAADNGLAARAWQIQATTTAAWISPRRRVPAMVAGLALAMTLIVGYFDSRSGQDSRWLAGLVYQWALLPAFSLGTGLLAGLPAATSRRTGFRGELLAVAWSVGGALACALLTAAGFALLAAALPPLGWHGHELVFRGARPHGIWLVPLLVPFAWLLVALRPRLYSPLVAFGLGPLFIVGHLAHSELPYRVAAPASAAAALVAFAAAAALRRRWWRGADLVT